MTFEWDEAKSEWTKASRDFDFDYASTVFCDSDRFESKPYQRGGEIRHYTIGKATFGELLFVVFTWRQFENEKVCRIISARQAHKTERRRYPRLL
jgi:uncharacterized DUF497 family protein